MLSYHGNRHELEDIGADGFPAVENLLHKRQDELCSWVDDARC